MTTNGERQIRSFRRRLDRIDRRLERMRAVAAETGGFELEVRLGRLDAQRQGAMEMVRRLRGAGTAGRARMQDDVERVIGSLEEALSESRSGAC